jgi:hypothetical protein
VNKADCSVELVQAASLPVAVPSARARPVARDSRRWSTMFSTPKKPAAPALAAGGAPAVAALKGPPTEPGSLHVAAGGVAGLGCGDAAWSLASPELPSSIDGQQEAALFAELLTMAPEHWGPRVDASKRPLHIRFCERLGSTFVAAEQLDVALGSDAPLSAVLPANDSARRAQRLFAFVVVRKEVMPRGRPRGLFVDCARLAGCELHLSTPRPRARRGSAEPQPGGTAVSALPPQRERRRGGRRR